MLIDVLVPALDSYYDFEIDEETETEKLTKEIILLIEEKEKIKCRDKKRRYLYAPDQDCLLKPEKNLTEQGIKNGDSLILI